MTSIKERTEALAKLLMEEAPDDWVLGLCEPDNFPYPFHMVLRVDYPDGDETQPPSLVMVTDHIQCPLFVPKMGSYASILFSVRELSEANPERMLEMVKQGISQITDQMDIPEEPEEDPSQILIPFPGKDDDEAQDGPESDNPD